MCNKKGFDFSKIQVVELDLDIKTSFKNIFFPWLVIRNALHTCDFLSSIRQEFHIGVIYAIIIVKISIMSLINVCLL